MITCIIRFHIDPTKKAEFERYARNCGQAISRCSADLFGYFAPHEGSTTLAYGIYTSASSPPHGINLRRPSRCRGEAP